jgi:hypothetical protein
MVEIDVNNDFFSLMLEFSDFPPSLLKKKLKNNENKIDILKKIKKLRDLIFYNSKYIRTTMNIAPKAQKTNHLLFFFFHFDILFYNLTISYLQFGLIKFKPKNKKV